MKKERRIPIYTTDDDGTEIVRVPLAGTTQPARILREDFEKLMAAGISSQWTCSRDRFGYYYVRCAADVRGRVQTVARLIMGAGRGTIVQYVDNEPLNLRRENLTFSKGWASRAAQKCWMDDYYERKEYRAQGKSMARDLSRKSSDFVPFPIKSK